MRLSTRLPTMMSTTMSTIHDLPAEFAHFPRRACFDFPLPLLERLDQVPSYVNCPSNNLRTQGDCTLSGFGCYAPPRLCYTMLGYAKLEL